jgi:hypothetical protein
MSLPDEVGQAANVHYVRPGFGLVGVPSAGDDVSKLDGDFQSADSREVDPNP